MVQVTYIEASGMQHVVDVPIGHSLMEGAKGNGIGGILADCSGSCACGTCKVAVAEQWLSLLPPVEELESATLEMYSIPEAAERLSCQLIVTEELEGIVITIPEKQF